MNNFEKGIFMMILPVILKVLRLPLRWQEFRGSWVLYAGWFELAYLEKNVDKGQLLWLSIIWKLPDYGWHAVDFDYSELSEAADTLENWAIENGFGRAPVTGRTAMTGARIILGLLKK